MHTIRQNRNKLNYMFRTHHQGVHSRINNRLTFYRLQYAVELSHIRQCVIYGRCISTLETVKFLSYKNVLKL